MKNSELNEWMELDEDNRVKTPECGLFCIRCKKPLKETQSFESFHSVEIKGEYPTLVIKSANGKYLVGSECWKKIVKRHNK